MDLENLDKQKVLCNKCFIEGEVRYLDKTNIEGFVNICPKHKGAGFHIRVWKESLNEWVAVQGANYTRKSKKEISLEQAKEPRYCSNPECENHKDAENPQKMIINNLPGLCPKCFLKIASKGGNKNSEKIGKLGFCTNFECKHKNEKVLIVNANGFCQDCSNLKGKQIGKLNFCSNISCKNHKDAENPHKVLIATTAGLCEECAGIQGRKNSDKIGTLDFCSNPECENYKDAKNPHKVKIINVSGVCASCSFKNNSAIGLKATERIGTIDYCSNPKCKNNINKAGAKKVKIANIYGNCEECAKIQGRKNSEKIGQLGFCTNPDCPYKGKEVVIKDLAGLCENCVGKNGRKAAEKIGKLDYCSNTECPNKDDKVLIVSVSGRCILCSNIHKTFLDEKLQPCGHKSKSVWNGSEYTCWECCVNNFELEKYDKINNFMEIPNRSKLIINELGLEGPFLLTNEEGIPKSLSKNYHKGSFKYTGNLSIKELADSLSIPYGNKTTFLSESDLSCGHHSKQVLINDAYTCWECYANNFENQLEKSYDNLKIIPTFLKKDDKHSKPGSKFEVYLVEQKIKWFVYVKFHENGNPLVVGKSGSRLVNKYGSDVSFDKDVFGGPARQLLIETKSNWDNTKIAIVNFENEQEALMYELYLQNKYKIFAS